MQPALILIGIAVLVLAIGVAIARLFAMPNDRFRRADAALKAFWAAVGRVFSPVFTVLIFVSVGAYAWKILDRHGWVTHIQNTSVLIKGDWLQGEFRTCDGTLDGSGKQIALDCGKTEGTEHVMPVNYWGRIERPEKTGSGLSGLNLVTWNCQRNSDSVTCWAID
jgi:hypothetical protein